jgi:hypothetical protein
MRKFRYTLAPLLIAMLLLSFSAHGFAANNGSNDSGEDREQLELDFNDSDEAAWAAESIGKMKSKQVLSGYEDGSFRPNQAVNRLEAVVTAVRVMGLEEEAKSKSAGAKLHFKDASLIDKNYKWAKGYIIVALEHGLFDTSESTLQPNKPASRIWIAGLLVKALGLEKEALAQMTAAPDFKDAGSIPAGAVGYVNIAVGQGIISGYPDETFRPNVSVSRAELAALLVRTNDSLLEQTGAIVVTGTITAIDFTGTTVTDNVYANAGGNGASGTITIQSFNEDTAVYAISPELAVPFNKRFIPASALKIGDGVSATVENGVVIEASLIDKEVMNETTAGISAFQLEIEFQERDRMKMKYKNDDEKPYAEVEKKGSGKKNKVKGVEALKTVEAFLKEIAIEPQMTEQEMVDRILAALDPESGEVKKLEVEIKFANGKKAEIELEHESDEDDSDDDDSDDSDKRDKGSDDEKSRENSKRHND